MCVHINQVKGIQERLTDLSKYTQLTTYTQGELRNIHLLVMKLQSYELENNSSTHNNVKNNRNLSKSANTHKSKIQECHD